jgi:hypothetical protein
MARTGESDRMTRDWRTIDRWLVGESWIGSNIDRHLDELVNRIGPRWASSEGEARAVQYICQVFNSNQLDNVRTEEYQIDTWYPKTASATVIGDGRDIPILPGFMCPPCEVEGKLVDTGFGTTREIEAATDSLPGAIAIVAQEFEPFTPPLSLGRRLEALEAKGVLATVVVGKKDGWRMEAHGTGRAKPSVMTPREGGTVLRSFSRSGHSLRIVVESRFYTAPAHNVVADLPGEHWPDEHLLLGAHHDTYIDAPGGNDNATGIIAVLETARVLARAQTELGVRPGRSLRFVTFSGEEQGLKGSTAYVYRHHGDQPDGVAPRLVINLDELATGSIKGLVLGFPHLRPLIQSQFDDMGDGLVCHVMAKLDGSSDHGSFLMRGIDAGFLWRWRFFGRYPDSDFHHEPADTADKVRPRELKEYTAQLARLLLRLSDVPPGDWPVNSVTPSELERRLEREREMPTWTNWDGML